MDNVKVLVIEDLQVAQKAAQVILSSLGCTVDVAADGKKAVALFKTHQYDLILMDLGLSEQDGIEVTREIRKLEKNNRHVPIVALTANYDESYAQCCLVAGMDGFLLKPLTKENGQQMIDKYVKSGNPKK